MNAAAMILTSNETYGGRGSIFGDAIIATAILDRFFITRRRSTSGENLSSEGSPSNWSADASRRGFTSRCNGEPSSWDRQPRLARGWGIFDRRNGNFSTGVASVDPSFYFNPTAQQTSQPSAMRRSSHGILKHQKEKADSAKESAQSYQ
jgi:hypothetical protein